MKLRGCTENKITKDKNGENVPHLDITEVILIHCNFVNNDFIFLKTFISEFQAIEVWFKIFKKATLTE